MKKSKITFAIIFSIISASFFGSICFFSFNFLWKENTTRSIIFSLILSALLLLLVFLLMAIKSSKRNFQRNAFAEIIALTIYIMFAILSIIPFSHYFTVYYKKKEIKEIMISDVDNIIKMFANYELYANNRISSYESGLNTAILGKDLNPNDFKNEGFISNSVPLDTQRVLLVRIFKDDLMPAQYDTIKKYAINWLTDAKKTVTNWIVPIEFMNVISTIDKHANDWRNKLKEYDKRTLKAKINPPFDYTISLSTLDKKLTQRSFPSFFAIICACVLHIFILFPYLFANRNAKHNGLWGELFKEIRKEKTIGKKL